MDKIKLFVLLSFLPILFMTSSCSWGEQNSSEKIKEVNDDSSSSQALTEHGSTQKTVDAPDILSYKDETEQLVETKWISFLAPKVLKKDAFSLQMDVLKPFQKLTLQWNHVSGQDTQPYTLTSFKPGETSADYKAQGSFGNLLLGKNTYRITAESLPLENSEDNFVPEVYQKDFSLEFLPKFIDDRFPERIQLGDFPKETDAVELEFQFSSKDENIEVYSYHPETGSATYTKLKPSNHEANEKQFEYSVSLQEKTLLQGENKYLIISRDEKQNLKSQQVVSLFSTQRTFHQEITEQFGEFKRIKGGWYVSQKYPDLSFHLSYDEVYINPQENDIVFERPSVLYTHYAKADEGICDYLSTINFEQSDMNYKGYSYQGCSRYRNGQIVYDQYVSDLEYKARSVVKPANYEEYSATVSRSLLFLETHGFTEKPQTLSLDDEALQNAGQAFTPSYILQLTLSRGISQESEQSDIKDTLSEEQKMLIEKLTQTLDNYTIHELFGSWYREETA